MDQESRPRNHRIAKGVAIGLGAVVLLGTAIGVAASAVPGLSMMGGDSSHVTCAGKSLSVSNKAANSLDLTCKADAATATTVPPSTAPPPPPPRTAPPPPPPPPFPPPPPRPSPHPPRPRRHRLHPPRPRRPRLHPPRPHRPRLHRRAPPRPQVPGGRHRCITSLGSGRSTTR